MADKFLHIHFEVNGTLHPEVAGTIVIQGAFDPDFGIIYLMAPAAFVHWQQGPRLQTRAQAKTDGFAGDLPAADGEMVFTFIQKGPEVTNQRFVLKFLPGTETHITRFVDRRLGTVGMEVKPTVTV